MSRRAVVPVVCIILLITIVSGCAITQSGNSVSGGAVDWLVDQEAALLQARTEDKPILINFYTDACPTCRQMDRTTFLDKEVVELLNSNFTNLKSNAGKTSLFQTYGITSVPTYIFTTPDGYIQEYVITKSVGYRTADQFYILAQAVLDAWKS